MTPPAPTPLQPLARADAATWRALAGVFADIDDTLTTEGRVPAAAFAAMERLRASGLLVVPITGRPAGWCDAIARQWPVDAVVGENGAFYYRYDHAARRMLRRYAQPDAERAANRARLAALAGRILSEVPGCAIAADQSFREVDLAIDWCEDVPRLPDTAVARIAALMTEAGMTAKVSSIHVNGWFGRHDKLTMTERLMREAFDVDLARDRSRFTFVGDSPNDEPMFRFFPQAVGVANLRDFEGQIAALPAYLTTARGGAGFAEFADAVLTARA